MDWRLLLKERIAIISITLEVFVLCRFDIFMGFGSLQISLLCIMGELAGGESVAVADGVSDR